MDYIMKEINLFTDEVMRNMGKRIQTERKKKGFKAIDFADIIGIGKDQLSRIENGKVPCKTEYLFVISQILEVSIDYIMNGNDEKETHFIEIIGRMDGRKREKAMQIIQIIGKD